MAGQPKKVLGIVGCEVLLDEIAYVISTDPNVTLITVIDALESKDLVEKLLRSASQKTIEVTAEEEITASLSTIGLRVLVKLMPIALHQDPSELREKVLIEVGKLQSHCNSILIFYGLCGNAFKDIERLAKGYSVPLTILRDRKNLIIDDCVGAEIGGTEEYLAYLRSEQGEYPLNAVWAKKWRHFMHETQLLRDENEIEEAKMVFKCMGYSRVMMLDTGLGDGQEYERRVREFATLFELDVGCMHCPLRVVEESYRSAISHLV